VRRSETGCWSLVIGYWFLVAGRPGSLEAGKLKDFKEYLTTESTESTENRNIFSWIGRYGSRKNHQKLRFITSNGYTGVTQRHVLTTS
jgi:hypothetical protein